MGPETPHLQQVPREADFIGPSSKVTSHKQGFLTWREKQYVFKKCIDKADTIGGIIGFYSKPGVWNSVNDAIQVLSHKKHSIFGVGTRKINITFTNPKTIFFHILTSLNQYVSRYHWWPGRWVIISQLSFPDNIRHSQESVGIKTCRIDVSSLGENSRDQSEALLRHATLQRQLMAEMMMLCGKLIKK